MDRVFFVRLFDILSVRRRCRRRRCRRHRRRRCRPTTGRSLHFRCPSGQEGRQPSFGGNQALQVQRTLWKKRTRDDVDEREKRKLGASPAP